MSFHKRTHLVNTAVRRVLAKNPALADDIALLEKHYMHTLPKPQPCYLAAVAILLSSPDVQTAMKDVSEQLQVTHLLAEGYVRDGINAAPDTFKAREELWHQKGVMRGSERYFIGTRNIAPGSMYDRAWQMGDANVRTILADAVQASIPTKDRSLGHAVFNYVAALLIPAGQERDFALNKLSLDHKRFHEGMALQASDYIRSTAYERGLPVPADLPVSNPVRVDSSAPAPSALRSSPAPANHKRLGAALKASVQDIVVPASPSATPAQVAQDASHVLRDPDEIRQLKRDLNLLKSQNKINESGARLYLWLHTEGKNGERTIADAAAVLDKPENVLRMMVNKVGRALTGLRGGDDLQGQGHQSRPVGP